MVPAISIAFLSATLSQPPSISFPDNPQEAPVEPKSIDFARATVIAGARVIVIVAGGRNFQVSDSPANRAALSAGGIVVLEDEPKSLIDPGGALGV